MDEIGVDLF